MPRRERRKRQSPGAATLEEARKLFGEGEMPSQVLNPKMQDRAFREQFPKYSKSEIEQLAEKLVDQRRKRLDRDK